MRNSKLVAGIGFVAMIVCVAGIMISMLKVNIPAAGTFFVGGIAALFIIHSAVRRLPMKGKRISGVIFLTAFQLPILFVIYESLRMRAYWVTPGIVYISLVYATLTHALLSALMDETTPNKSGEGTA